MEEVITRRMIPKYIEAQSDEFETITQYKTSDGVIFDEPREAVKHEADLKFEQVEKTDFWFPMIDDRWYKAKDEEELEFLVNHLSTNYGGRRYGERRLKPGEWFTVVHENRDTGDSSADHFVPLSKLKESYQELLKHLGEE